MKPKTPNMDVKTNEGSQIGTAMRPMVHGRVRFGRFLVGGTALVAMVAVAMLAGSPDLSRSPVLGQPQQTTNAEAGNSSVAEPLAPSAAAPSQPNRIGGGGPTATAIAISRTAFPGGASEVYVARNDNPVDALAASVLPNGPILLVPSSGNVPADVFNEIKRLHPSKVVVLGGEGAISADVAGQLSTYTGVANVTRLAGPNRVATAAAIAKYAYPNGNAKVYVADAIGSNGLGSPDAAAAGVLRDGPIITVSGNGADIATAASTVKALGASQVVALGGEGVVPSSRLSQVAGGATTARIAGADRYLTAQAINQTVFPSASHVYLASGSDLVYPLISGALSDGPVLLVPANAQGNTRNLVTAFGNPTVTAIGDASVVSDSVLNVAAGFSQPTQAKAPSSAPVAGVSQVYTKYSMQPSPADQAREEAVFNAINATRNSAGVPSLTRDPVMDDAARAWAQQVARTDVFVHSNGALKYADLFPAGWKFAGENMVGYYNVDPAAYAAGSTKAWVASPGHYRNLMDARFNRTGIGTATGRQWVYTVQNFGQY